MRPQYPTMKLDESNCGQVGVWNCFRQSCCWCFYYVGNDAPSMYRKQRRMYTVHAGNIVFLVDLVYDADIQCFDTHHLITNLNSELRTIPTKKSISISSLKFHPKLMQI